MVNLKFRAWDKEKEMWVNDVYISQDGWLFQLSIDDHNPNIEIVLCTGLYDCNVREIYEGDILGKELHWSIRIEFERGVFWVRDVGKVRYINKILNIPIAYFDLSEWEVIGNVFENLELMKGGGE